jgi:hypothetical protein
MKAGPASVYQQLSTSEEPTGIQYRHLSLTAVERRSKCGWDMHIRGTVF